MSLNPMTGAGIVIALAAAAGCLDSSGQLAEVPPTPTRAVAQNGTSSHSFDLKTAYAVSAAGMTMTDMESVHYSDVPANATNVTLRITWTPVLGVGTEQDCMLHDGTGQKMGTTLAAGRGPSPLRLGPANLNSPVRSVAVMCGTAGDPGAAVNQEVHVEVTFGLRPTGMALGGH